MTVDTDLAPPRCHCGRFMSRSYYFDGIARRFFRICWRCLHGRNG